MAIETYAVTVGDNCVDHYLPPVNRNFSGGNAVNTAVSLQRAGCPTAYIGAIGNDEDGAWLLQNLRQTGVSVERVKVITGESTACTQVQITPGGERYFVYEDLGPKNVFELDENDIVFIQQHRLVHNTWQGGTEKYLARFREKADLLISQDYGERYSLDFVNQTIPFVDIAFFSLPENALTSMQELASQMKLRGPRLVLVTQGLGGSLAMDGNFYFQPACPIDVVDTLGAGDAYIGAFLAYWLHGKEISYCMKMATRVASQACTHLGGW